MTAVKTMGDIGSLVRAERARRGINQQQLADLAGVGTRFISDLERGKLTTQMGKVLMVAAALDIQFHAERGKSCRNL